jgi:hypothetical protein
VQAAAEGIMKRVLLAAFLLAGLRAESLCGKRLSHPQADLVQVVCVDWDEIRRIAPGVPFPAGKRMQFLIHAKAGDAVRVRIGNKAQFADLARDAWGRLVALVSFDGIEHEEAEISILSAL